MDYHYQWQEYLDSSLPDRNGWEPTCSTAPATDTPAASGCTSRFLPRGRPVRRRRLFPPPLNHYARGVRPQWSTPYYDCGQKWNREQPGVKFCSSPHSNCCDHDSQIDKTSTDKYSRASVKKNRKCRGSLHQPKSTSVAKNCDHSYPGNNKSDWPDNAYRNEYFSPSEELPKGHLNLLETSPMSVSESSVYSPIDTASQHYQELSCVSLSPNCCSKSRLRDFPQENSRIPFKSPNQDFYSDNGKEDKLSSIIRTTIFEAQEESVSSSCQANQNILLEDGSNNSNSGLRQIACEEFYNYCENSPASVQVCYDTSQNTLQDSSKKESSLNDIAVNFTNNIEQETDLYNLMQATDTVEQLATTNPVLKFEEQTNCDENIKQSVVIYDPSKTTQCIEGSVPSISEGTINITENVQNSDIIQNSNNSCAISSANDDSVSSLIQQNQLLTDLLSQLISGNIEFQKNSITVLQNSEDQEDSKNSDVKNNLMVLKEDIPDSITNSITSALDLDNGTFSNKPPSLQPFFEEDWIGSCSSAKSPLTKDSENLNAVSIAEVSETLLENKHHSNVNKVEEPNSNSLVEYNVSSPNEVFPSNVEPPSTDTDSNHIETTLGSITNYLLEDPFDKFTDALISFFKDDDDLLLPCMNPNSVLKVKQPRRKYKQMLKMKTKERRRSKISPDCRNLRCKSNKKIQSQTPRKDSDTEHEMAMSPKSFSDAQTQVTDEDFLTQFNGRLRSIKKNAETQWEDIHLKHQHKSREFDTLKKETNVFQKDPQEILMCFNSFLLNENENRNKKESSSNSSSTLLLNLNKEKKLVTKSETLKIEVVDMGKTKSDSFNPENRKVSDANSSLSDSAVETLAISYEDSYEAKLSANSKDQSSEDTEDSGSLIDPNSLTNSRKRCDSTLKTNEIYTDDSKTSKLQKSPQHTVAKLIPIQCTSSDRVLRKRKTVNYSEPRPKRIRLQSPSSVPSAEIPRQRRGTEKMISSKRRKTIS